MPGIFISYRHEDSGGYTGRLFDILSTRFGADNVFMDTAGLRGGDHYDKVLTEKVDSCDVLLAVIGERWLTATAKDGSRRLDAADDWVRAEINRALKHEARVIPVLVANAKRPDRHDLPEDLRVLSSLQTVRIGDVHFREDANLLVDELSREVPGLGKKQGKSVGKRFALAFGGLALFAMAVGTVATRRPKPADSGQATGTVQTQTAVASAPAEPAPEMARSGAGGDGDGTALGAAGSEQAANAAANISGKWMAMVTYNSAGGVSAETFNFDVEGRELTGTASIFRIDHQIADGKIDGSRISFTTTSANSPDGSNEQQKHFYKGTLQGRTIHFTLTTDNGPGVNVPVGFVATQVSSK